MSDDRLDALFRCEHLAKTIAVKHCLRRREERRQTKHPKTFALIAGEPENGYCATACRQGLGVRASVADVPAGHCARCGTAYVGAEATAAPCEECDAARVYEGKAPARGFLPPKTVEVSTRIWAKDAPDAPIAPPKRQDVGLTSTQVAEAAARVREAVAHPTRVATPPHVEPEKCAEARETHPPAPRAPVTPQHPPAEPAQEDDVKKPPENPTRDPGRAMTDRKCQCGCGRALRVNNTSGFSGYCNAEKYRDGARADRPSRAKAAPPLPPAPKAARARPARVVAAAELDADALMQRRDDLLAEVAEVEQRLRVLLANEEAKVERMRKAVASLTKHAAEAA